MLLNFSLLLSLLAATTVQDRVVEIIDGDTVVLEQLGKARLIGVDTPETVHPSKPVERFGKEAAEFTRSRLEGKIVRVEFDQTRTDRYGRVLVYLFLRDSTFFNAEQIRQGFAYAYTKYPFRHLEEFREYEKEARENGRGLWARSEPMAAPAVVYHGNRRSKVYHAPGCQHYNCKNCVIEFASKEEAEKKGFRPHKQCVY